MNKRLGVLLFSVIEVVGLVGWLAWAQADRVVLGVLVLVAALFLEHVVTDNVLRGKPLFSPEAKPLGKILGFSVLETVIWAVWLGLWSIHPIAATFWLAPALLIEHTISKNVHERQNLLDPVISLSVGPHTIIEVAACSGWLILALDGKPIQGVLLLLAGSILEHALAVSGTKVGTGSPAGKIGSFSG